MKRIVDTDGCLDSILSLATFLIGCGALLILISAVVSQ